MINLSISDPIDGNNKIGELRNHIGKDYYGNNKLLSVSKDGNVCIVLRDGKKVSEPSWITWNRFFY
jgi:hypothetical protein|tara:strand:+ start:460 stop:657 length:198 start_codon:yes stop_codon:yes gene_type:complete